MAIFRINKNKNYTTMSNYHLRDKNLSLKAKGLLSFMLSLPEDWDYSVAGLKAQCSESINTINGIIHELEDKFYLVRKKVYENGKIKDWEYCIYEEPNLYLKNEDIENEDMENLDIENEVQLNTNKLNIKELNKDKLKENIKETEIFDYWNSKPLIKHKDIKSHLKAIQTALKENSIEEIKTCIDRYSTVNNDKNYYFNYDWTLTNFLKQKNAMNEFKDDGSKWISYQNRQQPNNTSSNFTPREYTKTDYNDIYTDLDNIEI